MNSKRELTRKLICDEIFNQLLLGNTIGKVKGEGKYKILLRIKKKPITQEDINDIENKILKKNVAGYHYEFSLSPNNKVAFKALQEQVEKLKEVLTDKDFAICP